MHISGLQTNSVVPWLSSPQNNQNDGSTFSQSLIDATGSSDSDAEQEFMSYAKETPAQRMFTDWLASQDVSQSEYNSMTPAQQQALVKRFEQQLEQELNPSAPAAVAGAGVQQGLSNGLSTANPSILATI